MKAVNLKPVKQHHTNTKLLGPGDVADLPITRVQYPEGDRYVISVWKASFTDRVKFLFDGRVNLRCMGQTHPPGSIGLGRQHDMDLMHVEKL